MQRHSGSNYDIETSGAQISMQELFYVSNLLSLARIGLIPLIVYGIIHPYLLMAVVAGSLAILSDVLDGYLARRLKQQSDLGKILDPLADKLVIGLVILALILSNRELPLWAFAIVVTRDFFIVLGTIILFRRMRIITRSNRWGKCTSFLLSTALMLYLLELQHPLPFYVLCIGLVVALISTWSYGHRWVRLLQMSKSSHKVNTIKPNSSSS